MLMRHAHEYEAKPRGGLAKRIVAVLASVAMLGGMGYATTSAALAEDTPTTVETTTDQSVTTANETTGDGNATDNAGTDNAGDTSVDPTGTESDTNTGTDTGVNTANAANAGDATSSDTNSQTDTASQPDPQTVNAEQNSPSVVADVTDSNCIYAGTNALQRVCWLDMSKFDSNAAKKDAGQKMTVNLGGGLTMSFTARYSGNRTVVASGVPTWDERTYQGEAGHHAIFGVEGYSDFPAGSKPALYQNDGYQNDSRIQLSKITIAKDGQNVTNLQYSFVMADAESTNKDEQMVYASSSAITQLGSYPTDGSNYSFCKPQFSTDNQTITCTGKDGDSVPQGIRLYTTSTPTQVSIEMRNSGYGSRQGAAFGVIFSQAVAKITVNGDTSATFNAGVLGETGSLESGVISSGTRESGTLPILAAAGEKKTVRFYLTSTTTDWSKYDVTFEGTDNGKVVSGLAIQTDGSGRRYVDMTVAADHTVQGHFTVTAKPEPLGVPEHHKTIAKKNGANDTYTLNLNVTSKRSSTSQTVSQPVDIALVLDNSGSMNYCMSGRQPFYFPPCSGDDPVRSAALKTAVTAFLDGVDTQNKTIANADNKVQVSLVSFADSASTLSGLTPDVTTLKTKVNSLKPQGATNTADGFSEAKSTLDKDTRTNAIKYVVFFTDGVPTTKNAFSSTVANNTLTTAKQLKDANISVYGVGIFSGADASVTSYDWRTNTDTHKANVFMNAVSSNYPNYGSVAWDDWSGVTLSGGSDRGYYKTASTASELSKVFEDIQQTITTTNGYTGVTIQDTLSEYAEFADADPAKKAKVVTNDDTDVTAQWNIKVNGKTITASPTSSDPLPDGVTYTLQFDIKPTQKAYDDYAANKNAEKDGYDGVTGSAGSDAAGNATSVDKPGFYTNDSACLAYSGDGETHACSDTPYTEQPVDQVKTGAITVQKKWADADGKASSEGNPESVTFTLQIDEKDSREAAATADTNWTATFENLAPGHTYKVVEKAVEGYETSYKSQDVTITADELWNADFNANTADNVEEWNVAVTNTHKKSTLAEGSIKVSKSISGREWKKGDSFNFTIAGSDPAQNAPLPDSASVTINANTANHEASFGKIVYKTDGTYTYTVKETKPTNAIAGLHYSQAEYTVTVTVPADMGTPTVSIKQVKDDNGKTVDNQSANVAKFTNTYVAVSALPLTGGTTDRQWLLVGGSIGGLAVLLVGAAGIWNSKKRLV
ncbi:VWA domain-containing protein [Bifidobacterium pseudocatenulatum]|nr:VWA domain-containing protein [Bifidobacterium pseudocatenulatum]RHJ83861.1 VWA domain-containing protein [Bifidobacterium pseudocatenulatum]